MLTTAFKHNLATAFFFQNNRDQAMKKAALSGSFVNIMR